jgi:hypothetical protein
MTLRLTVAGERQRSSDLAVDQLPLLLKPSAAWISRVATSGVRVDAAEHYTHQGRVSVRQRARGGQRDQRDDLGVAGSHAANAILG